MNYVKYKDYQHDGEIIDLEDPVTYQNFHFPESKNIKYDIFMFHYKEYLDKNKKYYLYCSGGHKSKRAVEILKYYGYNVVQLVK